MRRRLWLAGATFSAALGWGCEPEVPAETPAPSGPWALAVEADPTVGAFLSVWGASPDEVWAVGGQVATVTDPGSGAIYRRLGGAWAEASVPEGTPLLNWVHGVGDEIWAVGNAGAALRYDGVQWQPTQTGVDVPLWGVFVFGPEEVWAVGGNAFDRDTPGVIIRYDGTQWVPSTLPELDRDSSSLFKIFGFSSDDIHAVGASGVILHYDGSAWVQQPSGTANDLISLWGSGPEDIVAVGGRALGTVSRYDGEGWTTTEIGTLAGLNGVWVDPEGRASIVGNNGSAAVIFDEFEAEAEESMAGFNVLHAVYGFQDGSRIAVGGTLNSNPPYTGLIIENAP